MYYHHFQCIDVLKPYFSAHQFLTLQNSRTHVTTVRRKTPLDKYLERRADVFSSFYSFICENDKGISYFWKFSESILALGGTVQQNHVIVTCSPNLRKLSDIKTDDITWESALLNILATDAFSTNVEK